MSSIHDFEMDGTTLKKYRGPGGEVVIPAGVTSIGPWAFWGCRGVTAVVVPAGVTSIDRWAFMGCTDLTTVVIPAGVTSVCSSAFMGCRGLTEVVVPTEVTSIGDSAFWACEGLTEITLPGSIERLHATVFGECLNLEKIWVDGTAEDVDRIRRLLPANLRNKAHLEPLRRVWPRGICAIAIGVADANPTLSDGAAAGAGGAVDERSTPVLATVLSDGMRMCIPPTAPSGHQAENTSHQVVSEYAGMVALFL